MNAVYMQQYMAQCQYMNQIMNTMNETPTESASPPPPPAPVKREPTPLAAPSKKVKLSFGIDEILSPDFGYQSSTSSTASSSSRSPSPQLETTVKPETEPNPAADEASLLALQLLSQIQKPKMKAPKTTAKNVNRARTIFSDEQLDELERTFAANQYLIGEERVRLAAKLDLNVKQVKIWFQNRRIKHRRSVNANQSHNDSQPSATLNESSQSDCSESSLHIVEM